MQTPTATPSIVFLGPSYPYRGGIASFTESLAREFTQKGYDAELYAFSLQYPAFLFPGKTQYSDAPVPKDLRIKQIVNSVNPFNWIRVGLMLKNKRPNIVLVRFWLPFMGPCFGTILRIVARNKFTKIICIADNIIPHEKRIGDNLFTSYFTKSIHAFIAMSEQVMKDMNVLGIKQQKILLPHPIFNHFGNQVSKQEGLNGLHIETDKKIILFFGFVRQYKGVDILLKAMADQRIKEKGFLLLIAGEFYDDETIYLDIIKEEGLEQQVIVHNKFISEENIKFYFSAADVLIQPYRHATQSGVTPLALNFNLPMIVTNVGGLTESVVDKKTGLVTEPQPQAIADSIIAYFETGKDSFVAFIEEHKKQYSWAFMADGIIELNEELIMKQPVDC
jgi:glycosyltransferase involved in cell wall biosynthesis